MVRDEAAYRRLVEENLDFVWRTLRRFGVSEADTEDFTQQVFVVLATRWDDVPEGKERPFLYSTATRMAANARRSVRRQHTALERYFQEPQASVPNAEQLTEQRRGRELLAELIETMPEHLREVFMLFEVENLSMRAAAEALGVPIGTVGSRLARAREFFEQAVHRHQTRTQFRSRK